MTFNIESHINPIPKDRITNISDSKASKAKETYDTIKRSVSTAGQFAVSTITAISFLQKLRLIHKIADIGATNLLALKSLKHATSPVNYLKIMLNGASPYKKSITRKASAGMSAGIKKNCKDWFFTWVDGKKLTHWRPSRNPLNYRLEATAHMLSPLIRDTRSYLFLIAKNILASATPVLRFRFKKEEISNRFIDDPWLVSEAIKTRHKISPFRLGLPGALSVGLGKDMFGRMAKNPKKVVKGLVYLSAALSCAKLMFSHSTIKTLQKEDSKEISHTNKTHKEIIMQMLRIGIATTECLSYLRLISDNSKGSLAFNAFATASKIYALHYITNIIGNKKCNPPNLLSQYGDFYSLTSTFTSIARRSMRISYKKQLTFSLFAAYYTMMIFKISYTFLKKKS